MYRSKERFRREEAVPLALRMMQLFGEGRGMGRELTPAEPRVTFIFSVAEGVYSMHA